MIRIAILILIVAAPARPADGPAQSATLERAVDAWLKPLLDEDLVSGSILIARHGVVEVAKGYGPANREHAIPCAARTKYRIGSMTKAFTATAVMLLQERGLLKVEDPLSKYLPDFPNGDRITLHHLLTHTSGVINYSALPDHYRVWAMPHTMEQVIARFKDEPLRFVPGEKFEYSNSGYVLLTAVIEKVSGMAYDAFIRRNLFDPLGMRDSGMDTETAVIPGRATGHYGTGTEVIQAAYLYMPYTSGAGALYSTVEDLYQWDRALYTEKLLPKAALERMFTPGQGQYGYGWFIREEHGRKLIEHRGGINGFVSMIQRFTDDDVTVITLFNYVSTFTREINKGLAALALGEPVKPLLVPQGVPVDPGTLAGAVGRYRMEPGVYAVTLEGGNLFLEGPDQPREVLVPQSEKTYYLRKGNALLHFPRETDGSITRMIYQQSEQMIPCPREPSGPVPAAAPKP